jgi:DNA repair exonuclease SbcCD nuclease subunit
MPTRFLHTADWQLGKPYGTMEDAEKREPAKLARLDVLDRIGELVKSEGARFVLVAGDLFDSLHPSKTTVSAAFNKIGKWKVPVYAIPGNHDFGGQGGAWDQPYLLKEMKEQAPNFQIILKREPYLLEDIVLLPCPLLSRMDHADPSLWIQQVDFSRPEFQGKPRIVLAHGTTQNFSSANDEDGGVGVTSNHIRHESLPMSEIDFVALGDWHGMRECAPKVWYSGTPEIDRFPKGQDNKPGYTLSVEIGRGQTPSVKQIATTLLRWHVRDFSVNSDQDVDMVEAQLGALLEKRVNEDLLQLTLNGKLGIEASQRLEELIETIRGRIIRVKRYGEVQNIPSDAEIQKLTQSAENPLTANVAKLLIAQATIPGDEGRIAQLALRELFVNLK